MNSPRIQNASLTADKDTLNIRSKISMNFGGRSSELKSEEMWTIKKRGKKLEIKQTADGFGGAGRRTSILCFDKQ
jgi:hypothetical protein